MNFLKNSDENLYILDQLKGAGKFDLDLKQDFLNVKNKIELIKVSLINEKIEIDKGEKNKLETGVKVLNDNNVCENVFEQQQINSAIMIDYCLTTDKMVAECDETMSKYIQNINTTEIQFENNIHQYIKNMHMKLINQYQFLMVWYWVWNGIFLKSL